MINIEKMRSRLLPLFMLLTFSGLHAQKGHGLWLDNKGSLPVTIVCARNSQILSIAVNELRQGWQGRPGASLALIVAKNKSIGPEGYRLTQGAIEAVSDIGILYGVYDLLRRQRTGLPYDDEVCNPSYERRVLDHWDNLNGTIERGYAGSSIFWRKTDPFVVTEADRTTWREYARANASIGINGAVLNNVNASPAILSADCLGRVKAIADVLRPYGVKVYLSPNFGSPKVIGGLATADPLDPGVIKWWGEKVREIYGLVPDFGGFLIKANSEGQPGPQDYGRTHADGANMFAAAVKPYGGIVMWRAFVYSANDKDRAKQAYSEFVPLDGKFLDNVIIQVKNGPIDFQPREPFSPLFGALKKTSVMPEFQITQEYLGHAIHLVFLSTMWEECLQSDTYQEGVGSTVARCTDGSIFPQKHTAIAGVSNIGSDTNWCGNDFAQANWYAFGRLAWNDGLRSDQIAEEWIKQTFYPSANEKTGVDTQAEIQGISPLFSPDWTVNFLAPVKRMMMDSREAAVNYMMPLGLHHIMSANGHYGPGPWWAPKNVRSDWTPPYYHQAGPGGIGFDRTKAESDGASGNGGSGAVSQYHEPFASLVNDPATCPDIYLLWFHHLPWDYKMRSGRTLWAELAYHYDRGVQQVREFQKIWDRAQPYVDSARFKAVQENLRKQAVNAVLWKDACLLYFQQFSRMVIPYDLERPVNNLEEIMANDMRRRGD
jgi:alpha-glucuronidase